MLRTLRFKSIAGLAAVLATLGGLVSPAHAQLTDVGTLSGPVARLGSSNSSLGSYERSSVNEAGEILVSSDSILWDSPWGNYWVSEAALVQNGQMTSLSFGSGSSPLDLNEVGDVIGYAIFNGQNVPFHYRGGQMVPLVSLIGMSLITQNNTGQVIGYRHNPAGGGWGFIYESTGVTWLPTLGGSYVLPSAINDSGDVVGYSQISNSSSSHAFLYRQGVMHDLGALGQNSIAWDINEAGDVIGQTDTAGQPNFVGFLYRNNVMTSVTLGGRCRAEAITEAGDVIGWSYLSGESGPSYAFRYRNGTYSPIALGFSTRASAYNERGDIVGTVGYAGQSPGTGFLFRDGQVTDLGTHVFPRDINEAGDVVGYFISNGEAHGFLYRDGVKYDLGTLGGSSSYVEYITNSGLIVGWSSRLGGEERVFTTHVDLWNHPSEGLVLTLDAVVDQLEEIGSISPQATSSLEAKVDAALSALAQGNTNAAKIAMNDLKALVNYVEAQTGNHITAEAADAIIARANAIIAALGG